MMNDPLPQTMPAAFYELGHLAAEAEVQAYRAISAEQRAHWQALATGYRVAQCQSIGTEQSFGATA
jgi:hypothetical protein